VQTYPIKLTYHVRAYYFGERLIPERLGKRDAPEGIVAETWEVSDYEETTGMVTNGPYAGRTLHDLVTEFPDELVGAGWRGPHFPILEKFLDASHMLPVHLHADDETAARVYGEPNGKSEAWHILWAAEDASILAGIKEGASHDELVAAFRAQDYDAVMHRFPIRAGDTVYVPGGILHAFGPDTLIYEIQQTSDLGNDVMPTDLYGNPRSEEEWSAAIERTLSELKTDYQPRPNAGLAIEMGANRFAYGAVCPHFVLERWRLAEPFTHPSDGSRAALLSNVGDPLTIRYEGGEERLERAESCILPAALGHCELVPDGTSDLIYAYVPTSIQDEVVAPLRQAGYSDEQIAALGHAVHAV
jgi:mannose-6-phosphate isomerase